MEKIKVKTNKKQSRLGRGLESLIGEIEAESFEQTLVDSMNEIEITVIDRNPAQPRRYFDEQSLQELANSIRSKGVLQPILLRPHPKRKDKFQIVAGERRWRAAKLIGLKTIPATIKEFNELELLESGIIENVQRTDLNPMEEAVAFNTLKERFGHTQEKLAKSIGKSRSYIANSVRLLDLPESVQQYVRNGKLTASHARNLVGISEPDSLVEKIIRDELSVRQVEDLVRNIGQNEKKSDYPIDQSDSNFKDVDTVMLENEISKKIGLKVSINKGRGESGEVRIKYKRLEQLDYVCGKLTNNQVRTS